MLIAISELYCLNFESSIHKQKIDINNAYTYPNYVLTAAARCNDSVQSLELKILPGVGGGSLHSFLGRIPQLAKQATLYEAEEPIVQGVGGLIRRQKELNVFSPQFTLSSHQVCRQALFLLGYTIFVWEAFSRLSFYLFFSLIEHKYLMLKS